MTDKAQDIRALIAKHLPDTITEKFQTEDRRKVNEATVLGIAISQWAEWSGDMIMRVFFEALEDANYHTAAAEVMHWIQLEASNEDKPRHIYWARQKELRKQDGVE